MPSQTVAGELIRNVPSRVMVLPEGV